MLKGGVPDQNLQSTCNFFVDRLPTQELEMLKCICLALNGKEVHLGTACSGMDGAVVVFKQTFLCLGRRFGCDIKARLRDAPSTNSDKGAM